MTKKLDLSLYLVTNSDSMTETEFLHKVELALQNGITCVQLREKEKSSLAFFSLAEKLRHLTKKYNTHFIINDRLDIALAVDADGVHLGQEDLPIYVARSILGKDKIIGATTKTLDQAKSAHEQGADYLGVGAIYPTTTKVKTVLTSVDTLKSICQNVNIPVVAIGGLNETNLDVLQNTGIYGICVVSAIMQSENVALTVKNLKGKAINLK